MYYGFNHTAGIGVTDSQGNRIGTVQTFATKTERDKWADTSATRRLTRERPEP